MKREEPREGIFKSDEICPYCHCRNSIMIIRGNTKQWKCKVCSQFFIPEISSDIKGQ